MIRKTFDESINVRAAAFWTVDRLRGGTQARLLTEIRAVQSSQTSTYTDRHLARILAHAVNTTGAYRGLHRYDSLQDFPVIDKNYIHDNTQQMLSSDFDPSTLAKASTSGSTGTPLVVYQDRDKRLRRSAEAIHFGTLAGYELGTRLYNLKIWSGRNRQSRLVHLIRNTRPVDVVAFREAEMSSFIDRISHSKRPVAIISYASALEQLARYLEDRPRPAIPVVSVIAQSEALSVTARQFLANHWQTTVVGRYGTEEVGILGQQLPNGTDFVVNRAGTVVEILALDSTEPASPGAVGRIVVTDLHNRAMPIIRYDTGDLGRFRTRDDGSIDRTALATVEGRALDQLLDTQDRLVSSFLFYKSVWKYPTLRQFQVVQTGKGEYTLRLNVDGNFEHETAISGDFREHLGDDAHVSVEYVEEIPILRSGKRRQVVNDYIARQAQTGSDH